MPHDLEIRSKQWKFTKTPSRMYVNRQAGALTDGSIVTYGFLQLWGRKNGKVWRGRAVLAEMRGVSLRALQKHLKALEETGWIVRSKVAVKGRSWPRYVVEVLESPRIVVRKGGESEFTPGANLSSPEEEIEEEDPPSEKEEPAPASRVRPPSTSLVKKEKSHREASEENPDEDFHAVSDAPRQRYTAPIDHDDPEVIAAKKAAEVEAAKKPKGNWPPKSGMDVWRRWLAEVKVRRPKWKLPPDEKIVWGKEGRLGKKLMQRFKPDDLVAVIRVAIWDWEAIRGDDRFYAKKSTPGLAEIVCFADQLAGRTETGWVDHKHRVSAYVCEFVKKIPDSEIIDMSAVGSAALGRRKA